MSTIRQRQVATSRLKVHVRESGSGSTPVVLVHGNCSSSAYFEELMSAMPDQYRVVAPDLRGYGDTEALPIDATRGCGEWADDLQALVDELGFEKFHLAGWSLGGGVCMQYALQHADRLLSLTLIAPVSPYGFGGTRDLAGTPATPDYAGAGGGGGAAFAAQIAAGDRAAVQQVINNFYFKPPFRGTPEQEERWITSLMAIRTGDDFYPGTMSASPNWPGFGPGEKGILNTLTPAYFNTAGIVNLEPKVPILWIRGDSDQIVSDTSFFDLAFLGQVGAVPGWPGAEACPPQPMVSQTRAVLEAYKANGGQYEEVVIENAGHSPFIEKPEAFNAKFFALLEQTSR